jgi:outer membrane protein insertion porin family
MRHLYPVTLVLFLATFPGARCQDFGDIPKNPSTKIVSIRNVAFEGSTILRDSQRNEISVGLMLKDFESSDSAAAEAEERTRSFYLDRGYFRASVESWSRIIMKNKDRDWVGILIKISEGQQYRLKEITAKHNHVFTEDQVRSMIALRPGDIFCRESIAKGLEVLHKAYGEKGFVNFTSFPNTLFDEANRTITLQIDMDEGRRFTFGDGAVFGLVPVQLELSSRQ